MKNSLMRLGVLLLSTFGLLTGAVRAQQSPPSDDTYVSSTSPKIKFGSSILLVVGQGSTTYMRFNLAGVPSGATVNKATLRLFVSAVATGGQFDVYNLPATPTWSESTLTYNTPPPSLGSSATGGNPVTVSTLSMNNFVLVDITATVQNWLANPSNNNGVALAVVGTKGYFSFESKEGVLTSHEPELEIVLNGGSGTGSGTVTSVGSGLGLQGGPIITTGTLNIDTNVVPQLGATSNIFTGNISALSFTGNGAGLTNVNAASLNGVAGYNFPSLTGSNNFVGNQTITGNLNIAGIGSTLNVGGPSIFNMDVSPGAAVTANCLTTAGTGCLGFQFNGLTGNNIFNAQINGTPELNVDGSGNMTLNGGLTSAGVTLPAVGTATSATGFASNPFNLIGSASNGSVAQPVQFAFQTVPQNNGASNSSGSLNLLYSQGNTTPQSVLSIANNGVITFASGQNFPGTGSISSVVGTSPISVTPSGSTATVSLTPCASGQILQMGATGWGCAAPSSGGGITGTGTANSLPLFATLNSVTSSNVFQSGLNIGIGTATPLALLDVNGSVNALNGFNIGGTPFGFGSSTSSNAFLGFAGNSKSTNTGTYNTAAGASALAANTSGTYYTVTGAYALAANTEGSFNTANGLDALLLNTVGGGNTASGYAALFDNTGSNNTGLGYYTGTNSTSQNSTGSNNTFVGSLAGPGAQTNLNYATAIGAGAIVSQSNALVLGGTGAAAVKVGIGTATPQYTLDVNGTANFTGAVNFANSTVGSSTVFGNNTATSGFGTNGGSFSTASSQGTAVVGQNFSTAGGDGGYFSSASATGTGLYAGNTTGGVAGYFSGSVQVTGAETVGGNLTAAGVVTGSSFQIGSNFFDYGSYLSENAFLGFAGNSNPANTGVHNTAAGALALLSNTTGSYNTASGRASLGNNTTGISNTATGDAALDYNISGNSNTASGVQALYDNTGSNNTALGYTAGDNTTPNQSTGSNNTFVGYSAGPGAQTYLFNSTALGANAEVTENNALVLGSIAGANGCDPTAAPACQSAMVGIGTTKPQATLDVEAPNGAPPTVLFGSSSNPAQFTVNSLTTSITGQVSISETSGSNSISVNPEGIFLTGAINQVNGQTIITGLTTIDGSLTVTGGCTGCGGGGGSGTVTSVGTGLGLTGGTITNAGTIALDTTKVPLLAALTNTFTGNQAVTGNVTATGTVSGAVISGSTVTGTTITGTTVSANTLTASSGLFVSGNSVNPFAYASGSSSADNAFLGYAGEQTGTYLPADFNTAVGMQALNVVGTGTTGLPSGNTAMGAESLSNNTGGGYNTASGMFSLEQNTTGNYNSALGTYAGQTIDFTNLTASNDTAVGAGASFSTGTLSNATAVGSNAVVGASNALVLGSIANQNQCFSPCTNVSVGIGTIKPLATLDVEGLAATPPTVNFGSASIPATFTVNGTTTLANLTVTGTCNGCGGSGGGGGGGITSVTGTNGVNASTSGGAVTVSLNTAATNTFTGTQTFNVTTGNGIVASTASPTGTGVFGTGNGSGVTGSSNGTSGIGVIGVTSSSPGIGVYGNNTSTSAGGGNGVYGLTSTPDGTGVVGVSSAATTSGYGVWGQSSNTGVYGTGNGSGVTGSTSSATGTGVVGVNTAGGYAGYFQGNVAVTNNATVTGTLTIGGDTPMSHSPRMTFSGTVASFTGNNQPAGYLVPDQPIIITRFTIAIGNGQNSLCDDSESMGVLVGTNPRPIVLLSIPNTGYVDSGALAVSVPAGTPLYIYGNQANGALCQSGSNITGTVQYAMQ